MGIYATFYYGVSITAAGPAAIEWKNIAEKAGYYVAHCREDPEEFTILIPESEYLNGLWNFRTPKENEIVVVDEEEEEEEAGRHEIPQQAIDKFKQFLQENGIKEEPKWSVNVADTL